MNKRNMKDQIINALSKINFTEKYSRLCNQFSDLNEGASFTKDEVAIILAACDLIANFASKDKSFYHDIKFSDIELRLTITYKYGYIECFYTFRQANQIPIGGRFNDFCEMEIEGSTRELKNKFPIAHSKSDLVEILKTISMLHKSLVEQFS